MATPFVRIVWTIILLLSLFSGTYSLAGEEPVDVRLVIDVSGSMKQNDPSNLRQPAVGLLVELLPEGSKAGVWTFGKWVNMLIPHREVDEAWRNNARARAEDIRSVGLFTNIGAALEKAAYDSAKAKSSADAQQKKHIILLTDGMVDIDKDADKNKREWRRIVDELLPKLREGGFVVHTVALSDKADKDLMQRLSLDTDGVASLASNPEDLTGIFLKAFDAAVPSEQVPINDQGFVIDSSVEEFTALFFRSDENDEVKIITPDQQTWQADSKDSDLRWHHTDQYDLVTVTRPLEGSWGVLGKLAPQSRVTVVSNLNMAVKPLPNNVLLGASLDLEVFLQEDGSTIRNAEFLSLMALNAGLEGGKDNSDMTALWSSSVDPVSPDQGHYQAELPSFDKAGSYELNVIVDGKTFMRSFTHRFESRQAFGAEIRESFIDGKLNYLLTVNAFKAVDFANTQVVASIRSPSGQTSVRQLELSELDTWQTAIQPSQEGKYSAKIKVKGRDSDGKGFQYELNPVSFIYTSDGGMVVEDVPFIEAEPAPEPAPKTPEEPAQPEPDAEFVKPEVSEDQGIPSWVIYAGLALGNLLILGIGFVVVKKILGGGKKEESKEEEKAPEAEPEATSEPEQDEDSSGDTEAPEASIEEEPPMEDFSAKDVDTTEMGVEFLDLDSESSSPQAEVKQDEVTADGDVAKPSEPGSEEPTTEASDADQSDIDETAMQAPEVGQGETMEESPSVESDLKDETPSDSGPDLSEDFFITDDDEPVSAGSDISIDVPFEEKEKSDAEDEISMETMLKAQGLDLADDELDSAISSLIDDFEDEGGEDKE